MKARIDGPEAWNHCVFALIGLLFDVSPGQHECHVSRFAVGHTHGPVGRIWLHKLLVARMEDLLFTFDFWDLLRPHLNSDFTGYGATGPIHVIYFKRISGQVTPQSLLLASCRRLP